MILPLLLVLQTASAPLPKPLTDTHMRDIGCVATLGLIADEQRRGIPASTRFPNVVLRGRSYAGIVGARVMAETNQPREVVALAIRHAVSDIQQRAVGTASDGAGISPVMDREMAKCLPLLDAEVPSQGDPE